MKNEEWRVIPMFPTYAASNTGRIKNIKKDRLMAQNDIDIRQYQRVCIYYRGKAYTKKVARLVWSAFNDCDCGETIDHIDDNVLNNNIENLQCISNKDNNNKKKFSKRNRNKYELDDQKKAQIITAYKNKTKSVWVLSRDYNIPPNYLYTTFKRGSWNHLCSTKDTDNTKN